MASIFTKLFTKKPSATVATADSMPATVTPAGMTVGARPLNNPAWGANYTPASIDAILRNAETGQETALAEYFKLVDRVVEREMQVGGVLNGLVLAVAGLAHKAVPLQGDKSKRAGKMAEEVSQKLKPSSPLRLIAPGVISQGLSHGIGAAAVQWDTSALPWVPAKFTQKPAHFFTFDRTDGFTPLLRAERAGDDATQLDPFTSIVFTPHRNASMQIKNGLGWALCWAYQIKSAVLADHLLFIQTFGHPAVIGRYEQGTIPEDVAALNRAVNALNATSRGVFRKGIDIEFKEIARSNTDIYEKVSRYLDELISKLIWANTLSSDVGKSGSHALGKVHAEAKWDVIKSVAQQWAACLQVFFDAYVEGNFPPGTPKVEIIVDVEGAEDLLVKSQVVKNLHDAGVPLVATEIREAFGFSEPQPGDELIGANIPTPAPTPTNGAPIAAADATVNAQDTAQAASNAMTAQGTCPVHSFGGQGADIPADAFDNLIADALLPDWVPVSDAIDAALEAAVADAGSIDELRTMLTAAVEGMDVSALTAMLTKAKLKARLAGEMRAGL